MKFVLRTAFAAILLCAAGCRGPSSAANATSESSSESTLAKQAMTITTSKGSKHVFQVEIARTADEQKRGMQFRDSMAADSGMIFPMDPPRTSNMWMENTLISLDLVFIRPDGSIESIAADMVPQSREPRSSNEPVSAVLEIKGGEAARRGIEPGDKIDWAGLPQ